MKFTSLRNPSKTNQVRVFQLVEKEELYVFPYTFFSESLKRKLVMTDEEKELIEAVIKKKEYKEYQKRLKEVMKLISDSKAKPERRKRLWDMAKLLRKRCRTATGLDLKLSQNPEQSEKR